MERQPTPREHAGAQLLRQYQDAGRPFDGIHQMLLPHLRDLRRAEPRPSDHGQLAADVAGLGFTDHHRPATSWPNLVIDRSVLLSYARLDNEIVGAALVDAAHDSACRIVVSSLAYLRAAPALVGAGGEQRVLGFLRHLAGVEVADLTFRQADIISRLDTGEPSDVVHTALLALQHRCVVGTLEPVAYHRIGCLRTLDLSA
ncbi:hypothetical protein [Actinoplanes sp. URMC 104]|uniref:hypothetical protein n=1 Tax=Actinoplanes sp. URMC 104 TaxID=3423409 RepID=UPI003F1AE19C